MSQEPVAALRSELSSLQGPARMPLLLRLGQALMADYVRSVPGTPAAVSYLDAMVDAFEEAYAYLDAGDPVRGQVAAMRGYSLATRYSVHGGSERDRETGIHVLTEALSFAGIAPAVRAMARYMLGQLYLRRALTGFNPGQFAEAGLGSGVVVPMSDLDRASECLQPIVDDPVSDELAAAAQTTLELLDVMRSMFDAVSEGLAGVDFDRLVAVVTTVQGLGERFRRGLLPVYRTPPELFTVDIGTLRSQDPLARPVAVFQGRQPADEPAAATRRAAPAPPPDPAALRRSLQDLLNTGDQAQSLWHAAAELLRPTAPRLTAETVDELVAIASILAERGTAVGQPDGSPERAVDSYLFAVALLLRDRVTEDGDGTDRRAGAEELLAAATSIPPEHPAAIPILSSLGAFLHDSEPLDGVIAAIGGRYADRLDRVIAAGVAEAADLVTLHALRCLCRAAEALADLRRASGAVPTDYPWLAAIRAAGRLAESTGD